MQPTPHTATRLDVRRVLVPLDGSNLAAAALPTARAVAARFGAPLTTISVAADPAQAEKLRRRALVDLADGASDVPVEAVAVVADDPAAAIAEDARVHDGTLLVLSTRGHGRIAGTVLGSVAGDVLAAADVPFLAVGPQADRPGWLTGRPRRRPARSTEPLSAGAVVVLLDGTVAAEAAVPVAAAWADALDRELVVLTVAEDAPVRLDGATPNRFGPDDPRSYVDEVAERARELVPRVRAEVVRDPLGVASGLRSHLAGHPAALLVLAATRRTGFDRLRLGANAADIVRTAPVPALVVPGVTA